MIDTPEKLKVLRRSMAHAVNRLRTFDECDVHSPPDLRHLIKQFIRFGGQCEELYRLFEEAERFAVAPVMRRRGYLAVVPCPG